MPFTDYRAANNLRDLREDAGLSQEGLATAIKRKAMAEGWYKVHGAVDAFTIRAIEDYGHVPSERVRLAISLFFGVNHRELWQRANWRPAERLRTRMKAEREQRAAA